MPGDTKLALAWYARARLSRNIKGVKWAANKKALENPGGVHQDLKKIHNAGASWEF